MHHRGNRGGEFVGAGRQRTAGLLHGGGITQHADHAPQIGQGPAGGGVHIVENGAHLGVDAGQHGARDADAQRDGRHVVGHEIVQFAGEFRAFGEARAPRLQGAARLGLVGTGPGLLQSLGGGPQVGAEEQRGRGDASDAVADGEDAVGRSASGDDGEVGAGDGGGAEGGDAERSPDREFQQGQADEHLHGHGGGVGHGLGDDDECGLGAGDGERPEAAGQEHQARGQRDQPVAGGRRRLLNEQQITDCGQQRNQTDGTDPVAECSCQPRVHVPPRMLPPTRSEFRQ